MAGETEGRVLPDWAEEWIKGKCGCGSRLVRVACACDGDRTVCATSGWDIDKCPGLTAPAREPS